MRNDEASLPYTDGMGRSMTRAAMMLSWINISFSKKYRATSRGELMVSDL
jgi:hypothetical protein